MRGADLTAGWKFVGGDDPLKVQGLGFRARGLGLRVLGVGLRVQFSCLGLRT